MSDARYADILQKYFADDGYRSDYINRKRFKQYFRAEYGEDCNVEQIDEVLKHVGRQLGDRIFPKYQSKLFAEIIDDVKSLLDEGASAVCLESVYERYRARLSDELKIYDRKTFKQSLLSSDEYNANREYFDILDDYDADNFIEDVLSILKRSNDPIAIRAIKESLWYIQPDEIKKILHNEKAIVNVAPDMYFYAPNLPIDEHDLDRLITLIQSEIDSRGYVNAVQLMNAIRDKHPHILDGLDGFAAYGFRNCLKYFLRDRFAFNDSIITPRGSTLNLTRVFVDFLNEHDELSLDELKAFSTDLYDKVPWEIVLNHMVRVSRKKFIHRQRIDFDVESIDAVLSGLCPRDYVPLKEINLFLDFPNIGRAWNIFVVESFLFRGSRQFKLLHNSFSASGAFGAMVRIDCEISDYRSLLVDALSYSEALNSDGEVLQFIVDCGYQQRRTLKNIGELIQAAKLMKEQR